jgi:hypothetical protein
MMGMKHDRLPASYCCNNNMTDLARLIFCQQKFCAGDEQFSESSGIGEISRYFSVFEQALNDKPVRPADKDCLLNIREYLQSRKSLFLFSTPPLIMPRLGMIFATAVTISSCRHS